MLRTCKKIYLDEGLEGLRNKYREIKTNQSNNVGTCVIFQSSQDLSTVADFGKKMKFYESKGLSRIQSVKVFYSNLGIYL